MIQFTIPQIVSAELEMSIIRHGDDLKLLRVAGEPLLVDQDWVDDVLSYG